MRRAWRGYGWSLGGLLATVALRWALDPVLGDALPLVTLYGAVAAAVWLGGYRPAIVVATIGYVACNYLFIPPRGELSLDDAGSLVGLAAYLFTCALVIGFGEAARRAQRERTDQLSTARLLAAIVESSDDAIISKALNGTIQSWNAAAERLFGYSAAEAVGRHISLVIPADRIAEEDAIVASLKAGRRVDHFETERVRKDGRRVLVALTISPIRDHLGDVVGASKIVRDITDRKRDEADLRTLAERLAEADRRKDEFLALLAHELRNPLAPISNAAEALRSGRLDPETIRAASELLARQIGRLARLVDDLLDVSRITSGKIELRREPVELGAVVQEAVDVAGASFRRKEQDLTVTLAPAPLYVHADPTRLAQVVDNLLNNAGKFTARGGRVWLSVEAADAGALIRVRDNGIGIAAEHLPRLFEMFTQVDTSLERSHEGLGIGLMLVKTLVQMHGGTVEARSDGLGQGSEFVVRLPTVAAPAAAEAPAPARRPIAAPRRRILVVDDNPDGAASLALLLRHQGHEAHTARDGHEALEAAQRLRPDVVLLDLGLPILNGYEVCRRLRQQPWGENVLLVAVTGWGQEEDRRRSREAGFDAHVVKPVDPAALMQLFASGK